MSYQTQSSSFRFVFHHVVSVFFCSIILSFAVWSSRYSNCITASAADAVQEEDGSDVSSSTCSSSTQNNDNDDDVSWLRFGIPGHTRSVVATDHALITPESFVFSSHPDWNSAFTSTAVIISPSIHAPAANFAMYIVNVSSSDVYSTDRKLMFGTSDNGKKGKSGKRVKIKDEIDALQKFVYVLKGSVILQNGDGEENRIVLEEDCYAYMSPKSVKTLLSNGSLEAQLLVYDSLYSSPSLHTKKHDDDDEIFVKDLHGCVQKQSLIPVGGEVFKLRKLMPQTQEYDFNIHVMDFDPGEYLNVKEVHYNQHGLWMRQGRGIYRLGDSWYPVEEGDAIYMAPFVPQWYGALGSTPTRYIIYKDANRNPILLN